MSSYQDKLQFIEEEIGRLLSQSQTPLEKFNDRLNVAVNSDLPRGEAHTPASPAGVVLDNLEAVVKYTVQARVFQEYLEAIRNNRDKGLTDEQSFTAIENYLNKAFISAASYQSSQSTSWATDVQRRMGMVALGEVARLFQDVRRV